MRKPTDLGQDVSDTIAEHLHTTVARLQRQRSERLIQALALFNSGKSSLREWWMSEEENRIMGTGRLAEVSDEMVTPALREAKMDAEFGARRDSPADNVSKTLENVERKGMTLFRMCVTEIGRLTWHPGQFPPLVGGQNHFQQNQVLKAISMQERTLLDYRAPCEERSNVQLQGSNLQTRVSLHPQRLMSEPTRGLVILCGKLWVCRG